MTLRTARNLGKMATRLVTAGTLATGILAGMGAAWAQTLDGADISRLILDRLAGEGLSGAPSIAADRVFPECDDIPQISPMFGGWSTVAVQCPGATRWRFIIRTNLASRLQRGPVSQSAAVPVATGRIDRAVGSRKPVANPDQDMIEIVALAHSVGRNTLLGPGDLVMMAVPVRNSHGAFFDPADLVGRRMKSSSSAQRPILARHLHPDWLVQEGHEVLIISSTGGISVDMLGISMDDGQLGDWITVENTSSGKAVRAKIIGEKKVAVLAKKN